MRSHEEFWQDVFSRTVERFRRDGLDMSGWTMQTRPANDPDADRMVNSEGGFIDAMVGHADVGLRVLTLFVHEMAWDEREVTQQARGDGGCAEDTAVWWLAQSLQSIRHHLDGG
jgi:hypothetical protein